VRMLSEEDRRGGACMFSPPILEHFQVAADRWSMFPKVLTFLRGS
jgi:hypothetical protein